MDTVISESRFYMWRTLFALTHVDDMVTDEEIKFMRDAIEMVPFSTLQRQQLCSDMAEPQDVMALYCHVSDANDQAEFFSIARQLVHIDGDYGAQEQSVMLALQEIHMQTANVDALSETVSLEFEDRDDTTPPTDVPFTESVTGENKLLFLLQKIFHKLT